MYFLHWVTSFKKPKHVALKVVIGSFFPTAVYMSQRDATFKESVQ
jgi:hypothetical protein